MADNMWGSTPFKWDGSTGMPSSDWSSMGSWAPTAKIDPNLSSLGNLDAGSIAHDPSLMDSLSNWWNTSGVAGKVLPDGTRTQGWGSMGLSAAQGLMSGWLGMQQYGLAKEALAQQKKAFDLNYASQVKTTNARLNDQATARYASNPHAYQSPSDYMKQYGIGG